MKNKNLNEQINRIKSLFTEERLYGNLCEQDMTYTWDSDTESDTVVSTEPYGTSYVEPNTITIEKIIDNNNNREMIRRGDEGYGVEEVQKILKEKGYNIETSGVFDYKTENVVKEFQRDRNIKVDGIVGIETSEELMSDDEEVVKTEKVGKKPLTDDLIIDINNKIISNKGVSKDYDDLFLDTNDYTAVGILHFTKGGLENLYTVMDTEKYFDKTTEEMVDSIPQYKGKEYYDDEWRENMEEFLNSDESEEVQNKAVVKYHKEKIEGITKGEPHTPREYAIIMSISNSSPVLLKNLDEKYYGDYEKMMGDYCSNRCRTRCRVLNDYYPPTNNNLDYIYTGC